MGTLDTLRRRAEDAVKAEDVAALKQLVQDGAAFAAFTIQNPTDKAEVAFTAWRAAGRPVDAGEVAEVRSLNYWRQSVKRVRSVMALDTADVWEIATAGPRRAEEIFAQKTWGYGPAKSSFALACSGIGRNACLDVHMLRRNHDHATAVKGFIHNENGRTVYSQKDGSKQRFPRYWELQDRIMRDGTLAGYVRRGLDACAAQWADWLNFMDRPDAHSILL